MVLKKTGELVKRLGEPVVKILGEGHSGGEGTMKSLMMGESSSQLDWSHLRRGGA